MFVNSGARELLLRGERQRFLTEQWPDIHATILRLGLAEQLLGPRSDNGRAARGEG